MKFSGDTVIYMKCLFDLLLFYSLLVISNGKQTITDKDGTIANVKANLATLIHVHAVTIFRNLSLNNNLIKIIINDNVKFSRKKKKLNILMLFIQ